MEGYKILAAPREFEDDEIRGDDIALVDPDYRRRVLLMLVLAAAAGALALHLGLPVLHERLRSQPPGEAIATVRLLLMVLMLPIFPLAVSVIMLAGRIWFAAACPPPNARVLRDTPIVRGRPARRAAVFLGVAGLLLASFSIVGAFYIPEMLDHIALRLLPS